MRIFAAVMAGGSGERFWPLSRRNHPKQFLSILGGRSIINQTVSRLEQLVRREDIFIVTVREYRDLVAKHLPWINKDQLLIEPCCRDTSAGVALAAAEIHRRDPRGVMIMLPSDHYIADRDLYVRTLAAAASAASGGRHVATIGITPTRPDTGFGYILKGEVHSVIDSHTVHRALRFTEKPCLEKAVAFVDSGNYFWNSGIFVWRVDLIRQLISTFLPGLAEGFRKFEEAPEKEKERVLGEVYQALPKISVDYGILEKVEYIPVIRGDFGWDDVGSWPALHRVSPSLCGEGNVIQARGVFLNTRDSIIVSPRRVVAAMGISGLVVVEDGQNLLICGKNEAQDMKRLLQALQEEGFEESL